MILGTLGSLIVAVVAGFGVSRFEPILATATVPSAYPIVPRPLRVLVEEASFIVVARVEAAAPEASDPLGSFPPEMEETRGATVPEGVPCTVVMLHVERSIKGDPGVSAIRQVNYPAACPAPARYVVGTRVLAFLRRSKEGSGFVTHALSYGAKTLEDEALAIYLQRIDEQLAISAIADKSERRAAQLEWLVRCAEHHATRWEGLFELVPPEDWYESPSRRFHVDSSARRFQEQYGNPAFWRDLSVDRRLWILGLLLDDESFEEFEWSLACYFGDDAEPKLRPWLVECLQSTHAGIGGPLAAPATAQHQRDEDRWRMERLLIETIALRDRRLEVHRLHMKFNELYPALLFVEECDRERLGHELDAAVAEFVRLF